MAEGEPDLKKTLRQIIELIDRRSGLISQGKGLLPEVERINNCREILSEKDKANLRQYDGLCGNVDALNKRITADEKVLAKTLGFSGIGIEPVHEKSGQYTITISRGNVVTATLCGTLDELVSSLENGPPRPDRVYSDSNGAHGSFVDRLSLLQEPPFIS